MLEIKASIRIYTKGLSLNEVSSIFETKEDFGYSEGDKISINTSKLYSETMWGKNSTHSNSESIGTHIVELLDWLDIKKLEFDKLASNTSVKSDLFLCMASDNGQGGAEISSDVLKRISNFDLDVVFDIYISNDEE